MVSNPVLTCFPINSLSAAARNMVFAIGTNRCSAISAFGYSAIAARLTDVTVAAYVPALAVCVQKKEVH